MTEETKHRIAQIRSGEIPDGWKQTKLSEIGTFSKGSGIKREESNSGSIPAVRYGEIYTDHDEYINQFHSFISESVAKEAVLLKKGDLLFSCSGETKEDIGKCVAFVSDVSAYAGGDIIILSPHVECDSQYLGFLLNSYEINKQRYLYAQGDSIVHISSESLGKLQVALPPLLEQQKIARILSAQDKVISLKQKLLQEKQRQKKYLMRKLLSQDGASFTLCGTTIDKRGWKKEKLCKCVNLHTGTLPKTILDSGKYLFINAGCVPSGFVNEYNAEGDTITTPSRGQGGIGYVGYQLLPFWCGPLCYQIHSTMRNLLNKYLFYYLFFNFRLHKKRCQ